MRLDRTNISCGIYQLDGVLGETPTSIVNFVKNALLDKVVMHKYDWMRAHARPPIIIFSDLSDYKKGGPGLAAHIKNEKLGTVVASPFENLSVCPQDCAIWIWHLDYKALGIESLLDCYK
jgi:hypothetical protein